MPHLAHFIIGFESSSYKDPDFVPYCVLYALMGGGGSFSAGGPGKGSHRECGQFRPCLHENFEKFEMISTPTGSWIRSRLRRDRIQLPVGVEIISNFSKFSCRQGRNCPHSQAAIDMEGEIEEVSLLFTMMCNARFLLCVKIMFQSELNRAKTQLKSTLLMQLEHRPVMFEDVGRQVLGHGIRKSPFQIMEEIRKLLLEYPLLWKIILMVL